MDLGVILLRAAGPLGTTHCDSDDSPSRSTDVELCDTFGNCAQAYLLLWDPGYPISPSKQHSEVTPSCQPTLEVRTSRLSLPNLWLNVSELRPYQIQKGLDSGSAVISSRSQGPNQLAAFSGHLHLDTGIAVSEVPPSLINSGHIS